MAIFKNVFEDEQKDTEQSGGDTFSVSKPSSQIFGNVFEGAGSEKQQQVDQSTRGLTASTDTQEKRGFFAKAVDAGKNTIKFGLDAWNTLQRKNDEASLQAINMRRIGKPKYATIEEAQADAPIVRMMNSATGQKVISTVSEKTSNIPLKTFATFSAIGDKTYDEAYSAWLAERNDPSNPTYQKFLYELQDTGIQSAIGSLLALGTSYITKSPTAGYAVSSCTTLHSRQMNSSKSVGKWTVSETLQSMSSVIRFSTRYSSKLWEARHQVQYSRAHSKGSA
jgi:hypothetical protein